MSHDFPTQASAAPNSTQPSSAPQPAATDHRLREARNWYESAYEWRIVSFAMHAHARLNAQAAGKVLFYVPAIDQPLAQMSPQDFDDMRAMPNIAASAKLPGIMPLYIGMEVILTESYLPPSIVRGSAGTVVDIEFHPKEPPLDPNGSAASKGCVLLRYMPPCIYVRLETTTTNFLDCDAGAAQPGASKLNGVLAVTPVTRQWKYKSAVMRQAVDVSRTQSPLLPKKQCTLHGIQGKTARPGFIAHWSFPPRLSRESQWLATYVILSRPPSLAKLLSHGLPDRDIIEGGPPEQIAKAFDELFSDKIAKTHRACAKARRDLGWPAQHDPA